MSREWEHLSPEAQQSHFAAVAAEETAEQVSALRAEIAENSPTLRDQFAMAACKALAKHFYDSRPAKDYARQGAEEFYAIADAMLEARKR